jgi:hypothetical protein
MRLGRNEMRLSTIIHLWRVREKNRDKDNISVGKK